MSYKRMEATLVEKVQELKDMENQLMRSYIQLQSNPCSARTAAINQSFESVDHQLRLIERLMADMDRVNPVVSMPIPNSLSTPAYLV